MSANRLLFHKRLWIEYAPLSQCHTGYAAWQDSVLGVIEYAPTVADITLADWPYISVNVPPLLGSDSICEVWHSAPPLKQGRCGSIFYKRSEHLLFGCLTTQEQICGAETQATPLQTATAQAYLEIFGLLNKLGYYMPIRIWHYFPDINLETCGIERYRQFNIGRQDAFRACNRAVIGNVPTACALGTASGSLNIAFLATRAEVVSIENPRQISAYHYPSQYGSSAPTFSRAGILNIDSVDMLFISGTASIVGHQTLHHGDVAAQTRECMHNISAIVAGAERHPATATCWDLSDLVYKVYIRHPADLQLVRSEMEAYVGKPLQVLYLRADICRIDLLVEIEAIGRQRVELH